MLLDDFKKLETMLISAVREHYGERLVTVAVFGSVGRQTARFDSDLDFLIIARDLPRGRMKRMADFEAVEERLVPVLHELSTRGVTTDLSPIIKSPEEAEAGSPLFLDMLDDARILYDADDFFLHRLERLRQRLVALGARRIWSGNAWYWELKPDFTPGEVFEL